MKKPACIIVILVMIIMIIMSIILPTFFSTGVNSVLEEVDSPNGEFTAIIFIRDVDATTKESYQLCLLKRNEKFTNRHTGVYISYDKFSVKWEDNKTIKVKNNTVQNIFKQRKKYRGVSILYEEYRR